MVLEEAATAAAAALHSSGKRSWERPASELPLRADAGEFVAESCSDSSEVGVAPAVAAAAYLVASP